MNELIETLFQGFEVDGNQIPVAFLQYDGHGDPYITYMQSGAGGSYSGDDDLLGYVDYYDVDIYSKGNFFPIIAAVKRIMKQGGFFFEPSRTGPDMYETDTGYYHKTLCFGIHRQELEDQEG